MDFAFEDNASNRATVSCNLDLKYLYDATSPYIESIMDDLGDDVWKTPENKNHSYYADPRTWKITVVDPRPKEGGEGVSGIKHIRATVKQYLNTHGTRQRTEAVCTGEATYPPRDPSEYEKEDRQTLTLTCNEDITDIEKAGTHYMSIEFSDYAENT